jgi:WG containing repeat
MGPIFAEGLIEVKLGKQIGFADRNGNVRFNVPECTSQASLFSFFSEGLAAVCAGVQFGYVDTSGKMVIDPQFMFGYPFDGGGLAQVSLRAPL